MKTKMYGSVFAIAIFIVFSTPTTYAASSYDFTCENPVTAAEQFDRKNFAEWVDSSVTKWHVVGERQFGLPNLKCVIVGETMAVFLAAVNEERFVRKKNIAVFPRKSIDYVLKSQKLKVEDIDWVGCGAWKGIDQSTTLIHLVEDIFDQIENSTKDTKGILLQRIKVTSKRDNASKNKLLEGLDSLGIPRDKLIFCDHHYSHALTAFYCSPFEEAFVFTADGRGDFRSVSLWSATRREFR